MNKEARELLEQFQGQVRDMAEKDEISYSNDSVYGMMLMLQSVLDDNLTTEQALDEFVANSEVEITATDIEVITR